MDVVPPGDADVKNKEENIFRPQDKPAPSPKEVAEDWDYNLFGSRGKRTNLWKRSIGYEGNAILFNGIFDHAY